MKRVQEKVKDIVEVCSFEALRDFSADPAQTLANYHFTDATSELMAKWLNSIARVSSQGGAAHALAGYRGVGKSHFLAALGALAAHPELRSRVTESHVAAGAQRLMRRHYPVVRVKRGIGDSLLDELRDAVSADLVIETDNVGDSTGEILKSASDKAGDLPLILIVDTALERGSRVSRDDGPTLAEIAETAKQLDVFLGVALDDDIAGADGPNSAITRTFLIDYLDQEHLYKVVNSFVFPKNDQHHGTLSEIYQFFKDVLPDFRWSEQKFNSLYPLHPVILEVAPFVRLFVHDFALLSFASEAGERILGRPANSLIALDEVFDSAEKGLRKIEDLNEAFEAYDKLNTDVVGKIPVMQRLQAKLVLKALLLLSLDGRGATGGDICASMLIFDESEPSKAIRSVEEIIRTFAAELPDDICTYNEDGHEVRYGFRVASKDDLNRAIAEEVAVADQSVIPAILRRLMQDRFRDCLLSKNESEQYCEWTDSHIIWRGVTRRGRVHWRTGASQKLTSAPTGTGSSIDWQVVIDIADEGDFETPDVNSVPMTLWKPDKLKKEELDTILKFHVLSTSSTLRAAFGDQLRASLHSHTIAVEKILNRMMIEDGMLVIDGFDFNFTEDARSSPTLSSIFSIMLEPLFEMRYPSHPRFAGTLGMTEVGRLVSDFYSGVRQDLSDVQRIAKDFAVPMGLAKLDDGALVPESGEPLATLPFCKTILSLVEETDKGTVSLGTIYESLKQPPLGLVREAQHIVLTALVADRRIEFVTSKGDRINRRSLDLRIIWDDIVGVARPVEFSYSIKKLVRWAVLLTGDSTITSIDGRKERETVAASLRSWLEEWDEAKLVSQFNALPDECLNTRIWQHFTRVSKYFGSVADNIRSAIGTSISLEECLNRIADTFSASEQELEKCRESLAVIENFIKGYTSNEQIRVYLALTEVTRDRSIESLRSRLKWALRTSSTEPTEASNREVGYVWERFHREFSSHYSFEHDAAMKSHDIQERLNDFLQSESWWEFQNFVRMPRFEPSDAEHVVVLLRTIREVGCKFDLRMSLQTVPFCKCSFGLYRSGSPEQALDLLIRATQAANDRFKALVTDDGNVGAALIQCAGNIGVPEYSRAARRLGEGIRGGVFPGKMSATEMTMLNEVCSQIPALGPALDKNFFDAVDNLSETVSNESNGGTPPGDSVIAGSGSDQIA